MKPRMEMDGPHGGTRNRRARLEAVDEPEALRSRDDRRPFSPSPSQLRYLNAVLEAAANGQPVSDTAITRRLGMSRQTLWEWRRDARFTSWMQRAFTNTYDLEFQLALSRHLGLAIQGSVESFALLAKFKRLGLF